MIFYFKKQYIVKIKIYFYKTSKMIILATKINVIIKLVGEFDN